MINKQFAGRVTAPTDMMDAAKKSLSEQAFKDLMEQTGGRAPTPDELCKMVDSCRQASADHSAAMASMTFDVTATTAASLPKVLSMIKAQNAKLKEEIAAGIKNGKYTD